MFLTKRGLTSVVPQFTLAAASAFSVCFVVASAQSAPPAATLITAAPLAIDQQTHLLYAVDTANDRVIVTDPTRHNPKFIAVGHSPVALALDPSLARLYVVNSGSGTVSVINIRSNSIEAELKTDTHPYTLAIDVTLHRVYVTNTFSNELTVIDGPTNQITRRALGSKDALAIDELHHRVYLSSYEDSNILVLDEATNTTTNLPAAVHTWALAVDPTSGTLYAAVIGSNELLIYPGGTGQPRHVFTGSMPDAVAIDSTVHRVYVSSRESHTVTVIDAQTTNVLASIPVGQHPAGMVIDSALHCIYVAAIAGGTVSVIDGTTSKVTFKLAAGNAPYALALDPVTRSLFAANMGNPATTLVRPSPNSGCR